MLFLLVETFPLYDHSIQQWEEFISIESRVVEEKHIASSLTF